MSDVQSVIAADDLRSQDRDEISRALTDIERTVVHLSVKDDRSSVAHSEWVSGWYGHLCLRKHTQLANPRLEVLRCYLVLFRLTNGRPDVAQRSALREAGYSDFQRLAAEQLVQRLSPQPIADQHAPARRIGILTLIALTVVGCVVIGRTTQDAMIATVIVGALLVNFMSLFCGTLLAIRRSDRRTAIGQSSSSRYHQ